ncbi:MAG: hypothetical protein QM703_13250 [Gemmatales bacterium]
MLPIDPVELSAFLDGELSPECAQEVRDALDHDPVLRKSFEELVANDSLWKAQAETAMFRPQVQFAQRPLSNWYFKAAIVVLGLMLLRLVLKTFPPLYAVGMESVLLSLVIGWGLQRIIHTTDVDCSRLALATAY